EVLIAALPSLVALALYYSLAIHMRWSLGHWPATIGERGFPPRLISHANLEMYYFTALIWFGIFVLPVELVLCLVIPRLRRFAMFLALSVGCFLASCILRICVPPAFVNWWID
ncbi:MAG: hypothetical protein WAO00_02230, partial [Chthoniobacterales bacterium]